MGTNGRRGDAEQRDGLEGVPDGAAVVASPVNGHEAGRLTIDELMRTRAAEEPRSLLARLFGASPIGADSEQFFARALGERAVGKLFAQLGDAWRVLHSIPVGADAAGIDHLLIGPPGVFAVTTRNHPGADVAVSGRTVLVAGAKFAHIRDAEFALGNVERRLSRVLGGSLVVTGLLVFVDPVSLTLRSVPKDLEVLPSREVLPWLEAQPDVFDGAEVERVAAAAELASTWDAPPAVQRPTGADELDGLLRLVERSRTLRQLWFGAITIVIVVAATALATLAIVGMIPRDVAH